jgi:hypothetical protein
MSLLGGCGTLRGEALWKEIRLSESAVEEVRDHGLFSLSLLLGVHEVNNPLLPSAPAMRYCVKQVKMNRVK